MGPQALEAKNVRFIKAGSRCAVVAGAQNGYTAFRVCGPDGYAGEFHFERE